MEPVGEHGDVDPIVWRRIDEHLARNPGGRERLVPLLLEVQGEIGFLPGAVLENVAERLAVSPTQVYEVVSFYGFLTTRPPARHEIRVCLGTACFVSRAGRVLQALEEVLGVKAGGASEDQAVGLDCVRCLGTCSLAPALTVDGRVLGGLTPAKARSLAERLREQVSSRSATPRGPRP